jgi:hypothetical protein
MLPEELLRGLEVYVKGLLPKFQTQIFARKGKPLEERPKIVVAKPDPRHKGLGIYYWGQEVEEWGMIEEAPEVLSKLMDFMSKEYEEKFNHLILTLYRNGHHGIGPHRDKSHSYKNKTAYENIATIADLSLGATREFRLLNSERGGLASLQMTHGSHFAISGKLNVAVWHEVPRQPEVTGARISMVFRRVDNKILHPTNDLFREPGDKAWKAKIHDKKRCGVKFRRQSVFSEAPAEEAETEQVEG